MNRRDNHMHDKSETVTDHAQGERAPHAARMAHGRQWTILAVTLLMSALALSACSSGVKVTPVTTATVQSAATQVAPTVAAGVATSRSAASAVQPTLSAASTQTVATAQTSATQAAPTVAAAVATTQSAASAVQPTLSAASTVTASTVSAGRDLGAATITAAQTAIAPTALAAQTLTAPTRNALVTQAVGTFGPPIATTTAASTVQIMNARISTDDTTIAVNNSGAGPISISAWILTLGTFPAVLPVSQNLRIQPNATVTLHLARGTDTASDVYLGQAPQALTDNLKTGERIALVNLAGQVASVYQLP